MSLALNKTKIVCTIGPASRSPDILQLMMQAGMNIARLNFSHGNFLSHKTTIDNLRTAAAAVGKQLTIMADLPGPKMRIGLLAEEPIRLKRDDPFKLTTNEIIGDQQHAFINFPRLPEVVTTGDILFLNDGIIHLEVINVTATDVYCRVLMGGGVTLSTGT